MPLSAVDLLLPDPGMLSPFGVWLDTVGRLGVSTSLGDAAVLAALAVALGPGVPSRTGGRTDVITSNPRQTAAPRGSGDGQRPERAFDTAGSERLVRFLENEALRLERTASLLARARAWLRDEHVLAPADSVLRRAAGAARHKARGLLTERMAEPSVAADARPPRCAGRRRRRRPAALASAPHQGQLVDGVFVETGVVVSNDAAGSWWSGRSRTSTRPGVSGGCGCAAMRMFASECSSRRLGATLVCCFGA